MSMTTSMNWQNDREATEVLIKQAEELRDVRGREVYGNLVRNLHFNRRRLGHAQGRRSAKRSLRPH